jgi:hypothetical protein
LTWFDDLSPYGESANAFCVGWIGPEHPFSIGKLSMDVASRVEFLAEHARTQLTRGQHRCKLCPLDTGPADQGEIRVVGADGKRYAAPVLIRHYIQAHSYCPPTEFQTALLSSPRLDPDNSDDRCLSCGNTLTKGTTYDDLIRASDRRPIVLTECYCSTCDVRYDRIRLL